MSNRPIRIAALTSTLLFATAPFAFADDPAPAPAPAPSGDLDPGLAHPADAPVPPTSTQPRPVEPTRMSTFADPVQIAPPAPPEPVTSAMVTKWTTSLYGFVEFDSISDSTQGLNDLVGNAAIPRPNTYAGDHGQLTYGLRNSRLGFKLGAPTYHDVRATAQIELDFNGNQPTGISDASFYNNAGVRIRHAFMKLETPNVDLLFGQYWELFGWQSMFHPNTVQIQGVAGQIYSRAPQIRLSKTWKSDAVNFELAIAALRPPQRDSATPDGQAGARVLFNHWTALHTSGATGTAIDAASIGVSAVARHFAVDEFSATPASQVTANGWGVSFDALLPIIKATKDDKDNALTLNASFVKGSGIADLYTGLSGGVSNPAANTAGTAIAYTPNVDGGLVEFLPDGTLHTIDWQSVLVGLQYYLPASNHLWLSANYSHMNSDNASQFGAVTKVWDHSNFADGNLFWDATPAVRFGLEYATFRQTYVDLTKATDNRVQFSAFFIF